MLVSYSYRYTITIVLSEPLRKEYTIFIHISKGYARHKGLRATYRLGIIYSEISISGSILEIYHQLFHGIQVLRLPLL